MQLASFHSLVFFFYLGALVLAGNFLTYLAITHLKKTIPAWKPIVLGFTAACAYGAVIRTILEIIVAGCK